MARVPELATNQTPPPPPPAPDSGLGVTGVRVRGGRRDRATPYLGVAGRLALRDVVPIAYYAAHRGGSLPERPAGTSGFDSLNRNLWAVLRTAAYIISLLACDDAMVATRRLHATGIRSVTAYSGFDCSNGVIATSWQHAARSRVRAA